MSSLPRRTFLKQNAIPGVGVALTLGLPTLALNPTATTPAILGGTPLLKNEWPKWLRWHPETDEPRLLEVLRSGVWSRAGATAEFEQAWAKALGLSAACWWLTVHQHAHGQRGHAGGGVSAGWRWLTATKPPVHPHQADFASPLPTLTDFTETINPLKSRASTSWTRLFDSV